MGKENVVDDLSPLLNGRPMPHGADNDPRYPSPRLTYRAIAFFLDLVLHAGLAIAAYVAVGGSDADLFGARPTACAIAVWLGVSFVHRVVFQHFTSATLGKYVTGLRVIRAEDGGHPTSFGTLSAAWLLGVVAVVLSLGGPIIDELEDIVLPVVRRKDIQPTPSVP